MVIANNLWPTLPGSALRSYQGRRINLEMAACLFRNIPGLLKTGDFPAVTK